MALPHALTIRARSPDLLNAPPAAAAAARGIADGRLALPTTAVSGKATRVASPLALVAELGMLLARGKARMGSQ